MLADPTDAGTNRDKAKKAGYSEQNLYLLLKKPDFLKALNERITELVRATRGQVYSHLLASSRKGDTSASVAILKACGDIQSGVNQQVNVVQSTNGELAERVKKAREDRAAIKRIADERAAFLRDSE